VPVDLHAGAPRRGAPHTRRGDGDVLARGTRFRFVGDAVAGQAPPAGGRPSRSMVKNSLAALVRVMEQAVRDGIMDRNPARVIGRQRDYQRAEDELDDPRSLALPDWQALSLNGPPAPADR